MSTSIWNPVSYIVGATVSSFAYLSSKANAVVRALQSKLDDTVSVKDFGADNTGVLGSSAAINLAINSFSNGAFGTIYFPPGIYLLDAPILTNNRSILFEGNAATFIITTNMTYGIVVTGTACEIRNISINKASGVVVTAGIYATGLQHVFRNITSRDQKFPLIFHFQDLKESHISNIRTDSDVAGFTGIVAQFDYCVNNTWSNSMLGFCSQALYGSSTAHPISGYHNEGLMITGVITVYAGKAVNFDNGTFIGIVDCCFDFCELIGVFVSNGGQINVSNTWIASNNTNGFIGVGSLAGVADVDVNHCQIVRGAGAITGTAGVSLPGVNATANFNHFSSGMNGGVVTQGSASGNKYSGGGTLIAQQEGNWTPAIAFAGLSVGLNYTSRVASYRKDANNVVYCQAYVLMSAKGSSVGAATLSGLPFPAVNTALKYVSVNLRANSILGAGAVTGFISPGTQTITLEYATATGSTAMADTNFTNTTELILSFCYQA